MLTRHFGFHLDEGRDYDAVAQGKLAGRPAIDANRARAAGGFDRIGGDPLAIRNVPDIHTLMRQNAGGVE